MRKLYWLALALTLGGCGGGREDQALEACSAELANKLTGKTYVLDKADMRAKTTVEGETLVIASQVTFDPGLPAESKQTFECKARIEGDQAKVIALTFSW